MKSNITKSKMSRKKSNRKQMQVEVSPQDPSDEYEDEEPSTSYTTRDSVGGLGALSNIVFAMILIGVMVVVGFKITEGLSMDYTDGVVLNATGEVEEAFTQISDNLSLVATIGIFVIVLGVVMAMRNTV